MDLAVFLSGSKYFFPLHVEKTDGFMSTLQNTWQTVFNLNATMYVSNLSANVQGGAGYGDLIVRVTIDGEQYYYSPSPIQESDVVSIISTLRSTSGTIKDNSLGVLVKESIKIEMYATFASPTKARSGISYQMGEIRGL